MEEPDFDTDVHGGTMEELASAGGPPVHASLVELKRQLAAAGAETRRLRAENRTLHDDLKAARAEDAEAARLNRTRAAGAAGASRPGVLADPSAGSEEPAESRVVLEAEAESQRCTERVEALRAQLRAEEDLLSLRTEAQRMRKLLQARSDSRQDGSEGLPTGGVTLVETQEGVQQALCTDPSFEMLATVSEVKLAEEKKALQARVKRLEQVLREPLAIAPHRIRGTANHITEFARRQRRLQQLDTIAGVLHEELRKRRANAVLGLRSPAESFNVEENSTAALGSQTPEAAGWTQLATTTTTTTTPQRGTSHCQARRLNVHIQALSRRFILRRDLR